MDTRRTFVPMAIRKPTTWDAITGVAVSDAQMAILREKPVVVASLGSVPTDPIFEGMQGADSVEFVVVVGRDVFYVSTEGYDYARYAARILNADREQFR